MIELDAIEEMVNKNPFYTSMDTMLVLDIHMARVDTRDNEKLIDQK